MKLCTIISSARTQCKKVLFSTQDEMTSHSDPTFGFIFPEISSAVFSPATGQPSTPTSTRSSRTSHATGAASQNSSTLNSPKLVCIVKDYISPDHSVLCQRFLHQLHAPLFRRENPQGKCSPRM
uniref:Uncharacterized protein n=1 Tax=Compsopogon caeruleus TaxID=31354 RepID=A0A6T6B5G2_9RHOD|mmetsp:Transcript_12595/g.25562  ORF Transcript_12595/g.25562 Transcript_12595/m.25562 type:complete len:124 (+) Transcript_12595:1461-1832(+)